MRVLSSLSSILQHEVGGVLGRNHTDAEIGCKLLRESLRLAEAADDPYAISFCAYSLADNMVYLGRFDEAVSWSKWALQVFNGAGLKDGSRHLNILVSYANAKTITGQTEGLLETLTEAVDAAHTCELEAGLSVRMALANLWIVLGKLDKAEKLALENLEYASHRRRHRIGDLVLPLIRIMLEQGRVDEAMAQAQNAAILVRNEEPFYALPASLALGMVYAFSEPKTAQRYLKSVLETEDIEATFKIMAALHLLKTKTVSFADLEPKVQTMLQALTPSGFRLFCGPETAFEGVFKAIRPPNEVPLQIKVLGQKEILLEGQRLKLTDRALEVLVLLALNPQGLPAELLHEKLYAEGRNFQAMRAAVSRLRNVIPVSSFPDPYRIVVAFELDVESCKRAIEQLDMAAAVELYRGPLLEKSDAPGIAEVRGWLEESLRQAALHIGTPDVLVPLAEQLKDDLELWQAVHAALPINDARLPSVRAQLQRVRREFNPYVN